MKHYQTEYILDELKLDFYNLLKKLQIFFNENLIKIDIRKTKLAEYEKKINDPNLSNQDITDLYIIIIKYLQLEYFLDSKNTNIIIDNDDFKKAILGMPELNDSHHDYNGFFYELSMASRIIKQCHGALDINLGSVCDIIVDKKLAIECKYIISEKKLSKNISDAIEQINTRIKNKSAERGIIALDLSNIVNKDEIINFSKNVFEKFMVHQSVMNGTGYFYNKLQHPTDLLKTNKMFQTIIQSYIQQELEFSFYKSLKTECIKKLEGHSSIKAIIYQCYIGVHLEYIFENELEIIPLPVRAMTYFLNENLPENEKNEVKNEIHNLAVGL